MVGPLSENANFRVTAFFVGGIDREGGDEIEKN
jgi:hypothetical protein